MPLSFPLSKVCNGYVFSDHQLAHVFSGSNGHIIYLEDAAGHVLPHVECLRMPLKVTEQKREPPPEKRPAYKVWETSSTQCRN